MLRVCAFFVVLCLGSAAAEPPHRIVSTAPSITEMLYALNLGDRVVGVTIYCHYPPEARSKPKIGTYLKPDLEAVLQLKPDLVVGLKRFTDLGPKLRRFGVRVLELDHGTLEDIYRSLLALGQRTVTEGTARDKVTVIRDELGKIQSRLAAQPRRRVMFIVGRTPGTVQDLVAVGRASFLNELIAITGGENIFQDSVAGYPRVSREEIFARRPEVIIDMGDMADTDHVAVEHKKSVVALWEKFPMLPAVRSGRVYAVASDIFVVPGPRVVEAARELARMIHPEVGL